MKGIYGNNMPVVRGEKNTYAIMDLGYISPGEVIVSMDSYITEAIYAFPDEIMKTIKMLVRNHLFKVDNACLKLCEGDNIIFHRLVAKLLFLRKRAQTDIQPTIAFLMKRVKIHIKTTGRNF